MLVQHQIFDVFSDENVSIVVNKNKALKRSLINYLDTHGNTTITELSHELNISVPKTTSLVNELIEDGLLKDHGKVDSTGGRRASTYGLVPEACFFIGVDVKRYYINIGLLDFTKQLISTSEKLTYKLENTPEALDQLISIIKQFIAELPVDESKVLGICVSLSGRISTATGHNYNYFNFLQEPLSEILLRETGIQSFQENDTKTMSYGEFCCGEVKGEKNVLFVNLDYGIGMGILLDGKVYYGKSGFSGEFGHIPMFDNEIICYCGKKGCFETEASGLSLLRKFREKIEKGSTSSILDHKKDVAEIKLLDILRATKQEDVLCIELLADIGDKIGRGLAMLINIFNPELLILGGILSETGDYLRLPILSAINKYSPSVVNSDTQLILSRLGEKAGIMGSCLIARNKILSIQG